MYIHGFESNKFCLKEKYIFQYKYASDTLLDYLVHIRIYASNLICHHKQDVQSEIRKYPLIN